MNHGSLFSGIGGFDLAAEWMGWTNVFHCEYNPFGQRVLKHYWPNAISYGDIKQTDFSIHRGSIDVISGGFPCQPFSSAGKRKGTEDDRHLWPEMLRAIREIQPSFVVGENVRGFTNWNGGMVFDQVQADLEAEGYEVLPFLLPACAVNAPHRRDRIWIVAHRTGKGLEGRTKRKKGGVQFAERSKQVITSHAIGDGHGYELGQSGRKEEGQQGAQQRKERDQEERQRDGCNAERVAFEGTTPDTGLLRSKEYEKQATGVEQRDKWDAPDTGEVGFCGQKQIGELGRIGLSGNGQRSVRDNWSNFPTQPPIRTRDDGFSPELDGITVSRHRKESIMAYGNAIVPQVAFELFKVIDNLHK